MSSFQRMPTPNSFLHQSGLTGSHPSEQSFCFEDQFDNSSFPFLTPDTSMDHYIGTPEPYASHDDPNVPRSMPAQPAHEEANSPRDVSMEATAEGDVSLPHNHQGNPQQPLAPPMLYPPVGYQGPFFMPSGAHGMHYYHPYPRYGDVRSPKYPTLHMPQPMSPPLSMSPPGSSSHQHRPLMNTPPSTSSGVISPGSALSDPSSSSYGWAPGAPLVPGLGGIYAATPLHTVSSLPDTSPITGHEGVQNLPFAPMPLVATAAGPTRNMRPRPTRQQTVPSASRVRKVEPDIDDDDQIKTRSALGLSPMDDLDGGSSVPATREGVRRARIESEQRRRDELREGFERLKNALPRSNQRPSKSNLLDRSVSYIHHIELQNRHIAQQCAELHAEHARLRASYDNVVASMSARNARGSSGSSPRSNQGVSP